MLAREVLVWLVLLPVAGPTAHAQASYRDFRNTTGLNLLQQAAVADRGIRLVPARRNSRGDVWTQAAFPLAGGFRASFSFRYWHQAGARDADGNPGNDGLFFVIQPVSNALALNMAMPPRSLSLYFDGWRNKNTDDVSSSRLEVQVNGHRLGQTDLEPLGIRYRDGKDVRVGLDYDGRSLFITMNGKLAASYSNVDLSAASPGFVGFHGMGGDAYADVDLLSLHIDPGRARELQENKAQIGLPSRW